MRKDGMKEESKPRHALLPMLWTGQFPNVPIYVRVVSDTLRANVDRSGVLETFLRDTNDK